MLYQLSHPVQVPSPRFHYQIKAVCWLDVELEREKFYPGPGLEHGPLAFRANALTN